MAVTKTTTAEFIERWAKAVKDGVTMQAFADSQGVALRNIQQRRVRIEGSGVTLPDFPGAGKHRFDQSDFETPDWSADECIAQVRRVQAANSAKWITMRWLCNELRVRDTVFTKHFGTAEELFRQAGIGKTRQLSQLGKAIAKHVSVDHYRALNARGDWSDKYVRVDTKRYKTILGANDIHDIDCDPFWRRVFIETAKRVQPDVICINGDLLDLPEFGKYNVDPRTFNVVGRLKWVHDFFAELREACPDAQFDLIEGNHEYRLVRHMADASPAMMSLLSDLHGMTVADLFGLPKFEVNYTAKADLAAYRVTDIKGEIARNWKVYYECVLANHFPDAQNRGLPGWNGHHHSHWCKQFMSPQFGPYEWHQVGSGHRRDATYCDGEKWGNGFILWHIDSHKKMTNAEYIPVTDMAVVGGRYYHRDIAECWHGEQALGLKAA